MMIQAVTLLLGLLPALRTSPQCDSISPNWGKERKMSQHAPPSVNTGSLWEGAAGRG